MFTGTGTDHHDAHAANPNGRASPHLPTSTNEDEHTLDHDLYGQQRARAYEEVAAMTTASNVCPFGHGFDFTDPDVLKNGIPVAEFAELRNTAPVWWNEQPAGSTVFDDGGYWVVSRHEDIKAVSRNNDLWSTNQKGAVMRLPDFTTPEQLDLTRALLINHDPPGHTRLRKLISRLFTPRAVTALEDKLTTAAHDIVSAAARKQSGNFVDDIAMNLPLMAIADLIGVPERDREQLFGWTNLVMNTDDPDFAADAAAANAELMGYAYAMAEERRKCPADDIVTRLIQADVDGDILDDTEFGFFVVLLAVAGNETTRNAMTHGMNAFLDNPDQWELYKRERPVTAVDEIIRWATPVHCFQRTAKTDTEISGVAIGKGQRVGLFYSSANYDEAVFDRPFEFNVLREPNPHLGFGGNGAHYCIGANLARMEIRLIFNEIADIMPNIAKLSEPQRLRSGWINGVKQLAVSYHG
jgi:cholest-4-en-3-one 26-monooxygenase